MGYFYQFASPLSLNFDNVDCHTYCNMLNYNAVDTLISTIHSELIESIGFWQKENTHMKIRIHSHIRYSPVNCYYTLSLTSSWMSHHAIYQMLPGNHIFSDIFNSRANRNVWKMSNGIQHNTIRTIHVIRKPISKMQHENVNKYWRFGNTEWERKETMKKNEAKKTWCTSFWLLK